MLPMQRWLGRAARPRSSCRSCCRLRRLGGGKEQRGPPLGSRTFFRQTRKVRLLSPGCRIVHPRIPAMRKTAPVSASTARTRRMQRALCEVRPSPRSRRAKGGSPAPPLACHWARPLHTWSTRTSAPYTHLRAHEIVLDLVCRPLLEKKKNYWRVTCVQSELLAPSVPIADRAVPLTVPRLSCNVSRSTPPIT